MLPTTHRIRTPCKSEPSTARDIGSTGRAPRFSRSPFATGAPAKRHAAQLAAARAPPPQHTPSPPPSRTCACTLALWSAVSLLRAARSLASTSSRARALAAAVWLSSCSVPRGACSGGCGCGSGCRRKHRGCVLGRCGTQVTLSTEAGGWLVRPRGATGCPPAQAAAFETADACKYANPAICIHHHTAARLGPSCEKGQPCQTAGTILCKGPAVSAYLHRVGLPAGTPRRRAAAGSPAQASASAACGCSKSIEACRVIGRRFLVTSLQRRNSCQHRYARHDRSQSLSTHSDV